MFGIWTDSDSRPRRLEFSRARRRPPRHRSGRPVHQGADPSCLDCVGLSAPRGRSPGCDGLSVSLLPVPTREPLGPGRDRQGVADLRRSARRGLHSAELAGLLAVEREPGCKLAVSVLDLPEPEAGSGASAVVWSDPLELVALGLPAPGEVSPSCVGLLALGGLERGRPILSWRWTVGPSSASPGSRPPGAWISWSGPGWSPWSSMPGRSRGTVTILEVYERPTDDLCMNRARL